MLAEIVPKLGRNCQPLYRTCHNLITRSSVRPICTSNALSKDKNPAWDYIVPMIMRAIRTNMAKNKEACGSKSHKHWHEHGSGKD